MPLFSRKSISAVFVLCCGRSSAFISPSPSSTSLIHRQTHQLNQRHPPIIPSTELSMSNDNFDLSKPTFDLFSLRTIRNDALLQYSSLNQSEPLRINLYLILSASLFSFPTLSEAVIGETASIPATGLSIAAGIGAVYLFVNECQSRLRQLMRIEKEMNAEFLKVKLSSKNKFEDNVYGRNQPVVSLKSLRGQKRILAICGSEHVLKTEVIVPLRIFRRRLAQAGALVMVVPTDGDSSGLYSDLGVTEKEVRSCSWLGQVQDGKEWIEYFQSLTEGSGRSSGSEPKNDLIWFGLNYNGRSFASASGEAPRVLEILGQSLRPIDLLDDTDEDESTVGYSTSDADVITEVLQRQSSFYDALTTGDLEGMKQIYSAEKALEVSEILEAGGRIDAWDACLAKGARPAGMNVSGSDVLIVSPTEAYSTCIEFPADIGGYGDPSGATLLAMQRWRRSRSDETWSLEYHTTIPWTSDSRAGGTLRCDGRGCVALTRGKERRTFGGLIG